MLTYNADPCAMARESLQRPSDFAYFGGLHEDDGWGRAFGQSRDSDALERSNFEVITEDMLERFADDFDIERSSHWAVGWVDEGRVRVLRDPAADITEDNLTDAFRAVIGWKEKLDNYPVADESHWSALETEEFAEYVTREARWYFDRLRPDEDMPEDFPQVFLAILSEDHFSADDLSDAAMESAAREALTN